MILSGIHALISGFSITPFGNDSIFNFENGIYDLLSRLAFPMMLHLALRNLGSNRRRSLLTISSMVVSSALLILILGVFGGMLDDVVASATEQYHGHLVVSRQGYQNQRNLFSAFGSSRGGAQELRAQPEVLGASPRLRAFGLISHQDTTCSVEVLGVLPSEEQLVTNFSKLLTTGSYLTSGEIDGVLIGRALADRLGVSPGDELVFLTQAADGSIGNALLKVQGMFTALDSSLEGRLVLVNLPWLQEVMVLPDRIHEVAVRLADPMNADLVARKLQKHLPGDLQAEDWGSLIPEMRQVVTAFESMRIIITVIFYLAAGLGILNTFFMSVYERTREFGILLAIGMRPGQIRNMILVEAFLMSIVGLLIGTCLGLLLTLYMMYVGIDLSAYMTSVTYAGGIISPHLKAVMSLSNFLLPAILLMAVSLLAGFLPARRASRLRPAIAIRGE